MSNRALCGAAGTVTALAFLVATAGAGAGDARAAPPPSTEHLGTVSFDTSCAPKVHDQINRGVALLHDFWYEEAGPQFARIIAADPSCAMAHWGAALSGWHQIWDRPDEATMAAGWREMQAAQAHPAKTAREREYIAVLSSFFRPGKADYPIRASAYAKGMEQLFAHNPLDVDAGAFYALSLLAAESPTDTSLSAAHAAMAVLTPLWPKYPDHPGLVHYIIHACDTPSLAPDGLAAARHYGEIASSGPHAVHMPGHIFARLGMWQEDIDVNRASVAASDAADAHGENGWMDQFHSDDFLAYAYLQSGQEQQAKATLAATEAAIAHHSNMPGMHPEHYMEGMFPHYRTKLPVFYALEMRDWQTAAALQPVAAARPDTQTMTYWARIIAAGHLHNAQQAHADMATYDGLIAALRKGRYAYFADSTGEHVLRDEMSGWIAFADGNVAEAVKRMRAAADLQDKIGQGEVDIPAREMLADMLLESGRPQEALVEYQQALQLSPNRFNGLYNAGKAAEASGNPAAARELYAALLKSTDNGAHSVRTAEIQHARSLVATVASASTRTVQPVARVP